MSEHDPVKTLLDELRLTSSRVTLADQALERLSRRAQVDGRRQARGRALARCAGWAVVAAGALTVVTLTIAGRYEAALSAAAFEAASGEVIGP